MHIVMHIVMPKVHMLQSTRVAQCTCCKAALQSTHIVMRTCYKVHVFQKVQDISGNMSKPLFKKSLKS